MNPGMRPAGVQPSDTAEEGTIKSWLDALASGGCDAPAFLRAMKGRFSADPDGTFEVLSQLDQYYRRGRIQIETFKRIKTALAEMVLGIGTHPAAAEAPVDVPVAREIVMPAHPEQTDAHPRGEETQSSDSGNEPRPGSVLRRRYRIERILGTGGMGTVFQVLDEFRLETPGTQRLAVKILHPNIAKRAELLAELRREFQALQLLSHPNILRVFEFDRDGPSVFFTMELLTGAALARILQARKLIPLERPQALGIIRDIGAALAYAHSRGTVHGDLNPQDVFITGSGESRVMSFGASHKARQSSQVADPEITLPFSSSGYASCQVLEGERADARDDVFSLACIAYLLLSGAHPFPKRTAIEAREAKLKLRRPANLSGRQWQALRGALRWEREKRPADVPKWLAELELPGAVRRLGPLNALVEPPAAKAPKSWLTGLVVGVAALLFAAYWMASHRDMLPSRDSTASIHPASPATAPPVAAPPVAALPVAALPAAAAPTTSPPSIDRAKPSSISALPPPSAANSARASHDSPVTAPAQVPATTPPRAASSSAPVPVVASAVKAPAGASRVELTADTVDVPAGQASAQITVHRKGNLRGETSFKWWTESGTAKPGADFSAVVPQLAYVADGKSNVSLSVPVSITPHRQSKSFYVVIDEAEGGATLGARTLTMVTLLPSD